MQFATPCVVIQRKRKRAQTCIAVQHMVSVQSMAFKYSSKPRACEGQGMQLVYLFRCYTAQSQEAGGSVCFVVSDIASES